MAFESQFTADLETWTPTAAAAWDAANGFPSPGCVAFTHDTGTLADGGSVSINPSYVVQSGDFVSLYYRAVLSAFSPPTGEMIDIDVNSEQFAIDRPLIVGDTGWQVATFSLAAIVGNTVTTLQVGTINNVLNADGVIYIDNVRLGSALPGVVSIAQFYSGVDALTYRSDLPFSGVNPGAMAILQNRTAVLGSNQAAGQIIVYGNPESYASWNNMTTPLTTGSAVTSIKNV